jgi:nucleoside-diphosphate-sugar epimerase
MFIDDAVDAIQRILNGPHWNRTVNLAGGNPVTVETLVRDVAGALGMPSIELEKQGAANEKNEFWGSVRDMEHLYGFRPRTPLTEGISRFRDFLLGVGHVR